MVDRRHEERPPDLERAERARRTGWILVGVAIAMALATVSLILGLWSPDPADVERARSVDSAVPAPAPPGR